MPTLASALAATGWPVELLGVASARATAGWPVVLLAAARAVPPAALAVAWSNLFSGTGTATGWPALAATGWLIGAGGGDAFLVVCMIDGGGMMKSPGKAFVKTLSVFTDGIGKCSS